MLTRRFVDNHLVAFEPEHVLPVLAPSVRAMYENRIVLRLAPCTDFVVSTLARLVLDAAESKQRFRSYECLKTIRNIIRGSPQAQSLSTATMDLLFRLYQIYIYSAKEEVQWCVSIYLKDRELSTEQIHWLAANAHTSVHLVNRLLRYPLPHPIISKWAKQAFLSQQHTERNAEIVGLLIKDKIPPSASGLPSDTLIWAAYYSHASLAQKEKMIVNAVTPESAASALTIALRLGLPNVIRRLSAIVDEDGG